MYHLHRFHGFTLIELMIVIAIISLVSVIAVPLYSSQVKKAYRSDAKAALVQLAGAMERYRTTNNTPTYEGSNNADFTPLNTLFPSTVPLDAPAGKALYTLTITGTSSTAYTLTATPITGTRMDQGAGEGVFTLASSGLKTYKNPNSTAVQNNWDD